MFKYLIVVNLMVMVVVTQDMPPPDLEIPTEAPTYTMESTTLEQISTTKAAITTTAETTTEINTTPTPAATEVTLTTTTEGTLAYTTEGAPATTTKDAPAITTEIIATEAVATYTEPIIKTTSTIRNDMPVLPTTHSPFSTTTKRTTTSSPANPLYPSFPNYLNPKCYFKQQYGFPQIRWSCRGLKYVYPKECFQCCFFEFSNFAGCYRVHSHYCDRVNNKRGYYK